jgi:hypothetical protein
MGEPELATLVAAGALGATNVLAARLGSLHDRRRRTLHSLLGGVAVAYLFLDLLPHVAEGQGALDDAIGDAVPAVDRHAYLLALVGLIVFYGIEIASRSSRRRSGPTGGDRTELETFVASIVAFAAYNAVVGYVVHRSFSDRGGAPLALFTLALGAHLVVNDASLRDHHKERYHDVGRWILAAAVLFGWAVASVGDVPDPVLATVIAFLAGGLVLNVLKEELPSEREGRFIPFLAGAAGCGIVLALL